MKKKLLSIVSVIMAMSMATSAFAATPRGDGDVDGDGKVTANDVLMIMKGLANGSEANVDGYTGVDGLDAKVLYSTMLQPKTVSEDLTLKAYSEGMANDVDFRIFNAADLGSTTGHEAANGLKQAATTVDTTTTTTIKDAIDQLVDLAANQRANGITNQLNKIYFVSNTKGDVYLRSENGWAMFCNALRYIVPMDKKTAALCNKDNYADYKYYDAATATEEETARYDALNEVKAIVVGTQEDPAAVNTAPLSASDIIDAKNALYTAIPSGLSNEEITNTAKEVLNITDRKYTFSVESELTGSENLSEAGVDTSAFINGILKLKDYDTATMADFRNTFGDKLTVGTPNVKVTFEVAVVAGVDEESSEATTEATTQTTTVETTTEATTVETTTETTTEATTEAPVSSEWSFDVSSLTASADKEALTGNIGTDNFFTVVGNVTKRISTTNYNVTSIELAKAEGGAIEFTVTGNATVSFDASSTGSTNTSAIGLVSADGKTYYVNTTVTGSANGRTTYTVDVPAGTYRIVSPLDEGNDRGARVYCITVKA